MVGGDVFAGGGGSCRNRGSSTRCSDQVNVRKNESKMEYLVPNFEERPAISKDLTPRRKSN
jgi:hypothetical protein